MGASIQEEMIAEQYSDSTVVFVEVLGVDAMPKPIDALTLLSEVISICNTLCEKFLNYFKVLKICFRHGMENLKSDGSIVILTAGMPKFKK